MVEGKKIFLRNSSLMIFKTHHIFIQVSALSNLSTTTDISTDDFEVGFKSYLGNFWKILFNPQDDPQSNYRILL